jgi:hypothetical protein
VNIDALLRNALLISLGLWLLYMLLGGLTTRVGGAWRDGERLINLRQFGPLVSGDALRDGGWERYSGTAVWGRLRLRRSDGGLQHLQSLGFAAEVAPLLENQVMASFDLRLRNGQLNGTFQGRVIRSERRPARIVSIHSTAPKERLWVRA